MARSKESRNVLLQRAFQAAGGIHTMAIGASFTVAASAFNYINQPLIYPLMSIAGFMSIARNTSFYTTLTSAGLLLGYSAFANKTKFNSIL